MKNPTRPYPTRQYLNECFSHDAATGDLIWNQRPRSHFPTSSGYKKFNTRFPGHVAGCKSYRRSGLPGLVEVTLDSRNLSAHNIIFLMNGIDVPEGCEVDHRDNNPFNNLLSNLRIGSRSQNNANQRKHLVRIGNLPKGVYPKRKAFYAKITSNYKRIHLGTFQTPELAHAAYCKKAVELFGEFARFN